MKFGDQSVWFQETFGLVIEGIHLSTYLPAFQFGGDDGHQVDQVVE